MAAASSSTGRRVVIGVDGGGTKTAILCLDVESKKVLSEVKSDSTNWNSVGNQAAKDNLLSGIQNVLKEANSAPNEVAGICLGMAGVDRPDDKKKVIEWIQEILPLKAEETQISIQNDAVIALASGTGGHLFGLVIISGTGMIVFGYDKKGGSTRSGGWGPLLGDEGSGYDIGMSILRAVLAAEDGRAPETSLKSALLSYLQLSKHEDLLGWAYNEKDQSWKKFADLAPLASQCSKQGDGVATKLLEQASDKLLVHLETVSKKLQLDKEESFPLVLAGGNLTHSGSILASLLSSRISQRISNAKVTTPQVSAQEAAALLAVNKLGNA